MLATVAGDNDVPVLQADAGVLAGTQVRITAVTGRSDERAGEFEAVALGDPSGPADLPACPLVVTLPGRLAGEGVQPLDALLGESHTREEGGP